VPVFDVLEYSILRVQRSFVPNLGEILWQTEVAREGGIISGATLVEMAYSGPWDTYKWLIHSPKTGLVNEIERDVGLKTPFEVSWSTWFVARCRRRRSMRETYVRFSPRCTLHIFTRAAHIEAWVRKTLFPPASRMLALSRQARAICRIFQDLLQPSGMLRVRAAAHFSCFLWVTRYVRHTPVPYTI
jgi:hypothetical protein